MICEFCKSDFIPIKVNQRFCCKKCREKHYNRISEIPREVRKKYAKSEKGKITDEKRKQQPDFPIKRLSRYFLRRAIITEEIVKPDRCEGCGKETDRLEGHHYLGYGYPLDVQWLCSFCHLD